MKKTTTIGKYLIHRLEEAGLKHVFGIPGDYVLRFFDLLVDSKMRLIGTCTEAGAGFAADAYARVNGLGAVCVTYCVGGLNAINAVAGAYAEKSPVILISGAPGLSERIRSPLLHHRVKDFNTQRLIFEKVTAAAVALEDATIAPGQIDEVIRECLRQKRPVYIEIPRDMVDCPCTAPGPLRPESLKSDPEVLSEALHEATAMLKSAKRAVILGGVEIHRFGLQQHFLRLIEQCGYPVATTLLGKSIISERHPQFIGIYEGAMGKEDVRRTVEKSDVLLILGAFMTDIDLGGFTAHLDVSRTIYGLSERVSIKHHIYEGLMLRDFIEGLIKRLERCKRLVSISYHSEEPFRLQPKRPIQIRRFFARMNDFLEDDSIVICDIGDSLFGAADLVIHRGTEFLSPAYYTSMGFAVPAALGAQINKPRLRPIVFVGDGAFQMTGQELSTIVRYCLNPIVFILNNKGYTTERFIKEGPYNDIHNWEYHLWPQIVRGGWGCEVRTERELEEALMKARKNNKSFSIINLHLDPLDRSHALERLGKRLARSVKAKKG